VKSTDQIIDATVVADADEEQPLADEAGRQAAQAVRRGVRDPEALIAELTGEMNAAAERLDFELAAALRDQIFEIRASLDRPRQG
jgi:excinuclease UvrABC helicase subunit UvrB